MRRAPGRFATGDDVTRDGQRFCMLKTSEETERPATQINVVLDWFEELKQRVPTTTK
jgi:hypothetical protein